MYADRDTDQHVWFAVEEKINGRWVPVKGGDADTRRTAEALEFFYGMAHPDAETRVHRTYGQA